MSIRNRITQFITTISTAIRFSRGGVLLGRETGAGFGQEITIGDGLNLEGGVLSATGLDQSEAIEAEASAREAADGALAESIAATSAITRTAAEGPLEGSVMTFNGGVAADIPLYRIGQYNGKDAFADTDINGKAVIWNGVDRFIYTEAGVSIYPAAPALLDDPSVAVWEAGSFDLIKSTRTPGSVGQLCITGDDGEDDNTGNGARLIHTALSIDPASWCLTGGRNSAGLAVSVWDDPETPGNIVVIKTINRSLSSDSITPTTFLTA